jgi:hypothetical protein
VRRPRAVDYVAQRRWGGERRTDPRTENPLLRRFHHSPTWSVDGAPDRAAVLDRCLVAAQATGTSRHVTARRLVAGLPKRHKLTRAEPGRHDRVRALNPRVRGSSPWRRTPDVGSDLGFRVIQDPYRVDSGPMCAPCVLGCRSVVGTKVRWSGLTAALMPTIVTAGPRPLRWCMRRPPVDPDGSLCVISARSASLVGVSKLANLSRSTGVARQQRTWRCRRESNRRPAHHADDRARRQVCRQQDSLVGRHHDLRAGWGGRLRVAWSAHPVR